jgi:hypothetical protein
MLLNAEVKDDAYSELPRQADAQYAAPATNYLKADAATGRNYVDLNAAAQSYHGAWLFGKEQVQMNIGNLRARWVQWCPIPAGVADGVMVRGNVMYENTNGSYRMSNDVYEGIVRTKGGVRYFEGKTQHTFYGANVPNGEMRVVANLNIALTQRLAYNPMATSPARQMAQAPRYNPSYGQGAYGASNTNVFNQYTPQYAPSPNTYTASYNNNQEPDAGF